METKEERDDEEVDETESCFTEQDLLDNMESGGASNYRAAFADLQPLQRGLPYNYWKQKLVDRN